MSDLTVTCCCLINCTGRPDVKVTPACVAGRIKTGESHRIYQSFFIEGEAMAQQLRQLIQLNTLRNWNSIVRSVFCEKSINIIG